jgi:prepilin-type N-terminal cleavage/methylation domain-containing protein
MKTSLPISHFPSPFGEPPVPEAPPRPPHASRLTFHVSRFTLHVPRAFTLLEILVSVALLSFIVLGLFAMFNQTQRAFRLSMTQSDILEAGRAVTEMIPRELEQTVPSDRNATNFSTALIGIPFYDPLTQLLPTAFPATQAARTNYLQDLFMLRRENQTWVGVGYCVRVADTNGVLWYPVSVPINPLGLPPTLGAGSLYRFTATLPVLYSGTRGDQKSGLPQDPSQIYNAFRKACVPGTLASTNISRICDGVIHFRLRAFAANGFPLFSDGLHTNACFRTNSLTTGWSVAAQTQVTPNLAYPDNLSGLYFWSNAVPGSVEMELGLLEQHAWERYASIPSPAAALAYLRREDISSRVHIFRQRIAVRNLNPLPYQ